MADTTDQYILDITANNMDAVNKIKEVAKETGALEAKSKTATKTLTQVWIAAAAGLAVYIKATSNALKEYLAAEKAETSLTAALKTRGIATKENIASMGKLAKEMERLTGMEDDSVKGLIAYGLNLGISSDRMDEAVKSAIGLSKSLNIDVNQAMKLVSGAMDGNVDGLARLIPGMRDAKTEGEKLAYVNEAIASGWTKATDEMRTTEGALLKMKNDFGNLKEAIGNLIAKAITPVIKAISYMLEGFLSFPDAAQKTIIAIGLIVTGIMSIVTAVKLARSAMLLLNVNPFVLAFSAVGLAIVGVAAAMRKLQDATLDVDTALKNAVSDLDVVNKQKAALEQLKSDLEAVKKQYKDASEEVRKAALAPGGDLRRAEELVAMAEKNLKAAQDRYKTEREIYELALKRKNAEITPTLGLGQGTGSGGTGSGVTEASPDVLAAQSAALRKAKIERDFYAEVGNIKALAAAEEALRLEQELWHYADIETRKGKLTQEEIQTRIDLLRKAGLQEVKIAETTAIDKLALAQTAAGGVSSILGQMATAYEGNSKKEFKVQKAASAGQASIATVEAAVQAYKSMSGIPVVGPVLGGIAAAAATTFGMLNVNKILSAEWGRATRPSSPSTASISASSTTPEAPIPKTLVRTGQTGAPIIEINAKVVDDMALKEFSKDIYRVMEGWQARGEAY
jgi:hypothetical protein